MPRSQNRTTALEPKADRAAPAPFKQSVLAAMRSRLLSWFQRNQRNLPWRQSSDAYSVWLSEIMLQQTQVAAVIPYFERFKAAFPTVSQLAEADEQQVLKLWEGLGYYRRARNLHAAAKVISGQYAGTFPADLSRLQALPGVGRYTAGAIASIAFGLSAPILEANTVRVFSRLIGLRESPASNTGQRRLWAIAEQLAAGRKPGAVNQSLMEIGALVCVPRQPNCQQCPLASWCVAKLTHLQHKIPAATPKIPFTTLREIAVVVRRGPKVLVRQCQPKERWAGLWDFPRFSGDFNPGRNDPRDDNFMPRQAEIAAKLLEQTGVAAKIGSRLTTLKHGVTRFRITLDCYEADYATTKRRLPKDRLTWITTDALSEMPLSTTGRKIAKLLQAM